MAVASAIETEPPTRNHLARLAGALYLVNGAAGAFAFVYVPHALVARGDPGATARNILASETLFRAGMVAELACAVEFIFLIVVLRRLFEGAGRSWSALMAALALAAVPIMFVDVLNEGAALTALHGGVAAALGSPEAVAAFFLDLHRQGFVVAEIFFGLWLLPFGILGIRSGVLPRILGALLILACFAYLASSLTTLLLPGQAALVNRLAPIPEGIGELSVMAWLLIMGTKPLTGAGERR